VGVAARDPPGRHVSARSHVIGVRAALRGVCIRPGLGVVTAFPFQSAARAMEEEEEEARALLAGGPDQAAPRALPALCDPSRLAHRLLVLLLMCFLGFAIFAMIILLPFRPRLNGIGGESLAVAQNTYAVSWFKGKELNLVFGLQLSMARIGSTVNMNLMGWLYSKIEALLGSTGHTTLGVTLMIGGITCVLSLICALALAYLDQRAERILHKEQGKAGEVIKLTDVKDFSLPLWLIFIICVCYYVAVFPFIGLGKVFFTEKFGFSSQAASAINSVVYVISAPMSPVFGLLVDKTGRNIIWVLCAVAATLVSHMMLAFTMWNPWIAMCLLGISYSLLACALWPMVAFVVPEHQLGTAYGFMQSIQNLGLAIISIIAGMILDSRGYLFLEVFFIACVSLSLLSVVLLYLVNRAQGGNLNYSARQREEIKLSHTE
uniref:Lysosomal dipeptide transporter MFSD1 n=1 Tax=Saimiri boliviensis boliviensis TaxID=39432 RepID=A0A2K6UCV4_SAIBB